MRRWQCGCRDRREGFRAPKSQGADAQKHPFHCHYDLLFCCCRGCRVVVVVSTAIPFVNRNGILGNKRTNRALMSWESLSNGMVSKRMNSLV